MLCCLFDGLKNLQVWTNPIFKSNCRLHRKICCIFLTNLNCLSHDRSQLRNVVPVLGAPIINIGFLIGTLETKHAQKFTYSLITFQLLLI